jgi:hypothetical protein
MRDGDCKEPALIPNRSVAHRVLTFLEDRRVLYVPSEMECPDQ